GEGADDIYLKCADKIRPELIFPVHDLQIVGQPQNIINPYNDKAHKKKLCGLAYERNERLCMEVLGVLLEKRIKKKAEKLSAVPFQQKPQPQQRSCGDIDHGRVSLQPLRKIMKHSAEFFLQSYSKKHFRHTLFYLIFDA